jgi:hypothetical protein
VPVEPCPSSVAGGREGLTGGVVGDRTVECAGERVDVAHRHQQRGVADHLGDRPGGGGHHGRADLHRVEQRETEALVERWIGEHCGVVQQPRASGLVDSSGEQDPARRCRAERIDGIAHGLAVVARRTGEHQHEIALW